jgi:hypothetical protein
VKGLSAFLDTRSNRPLLSRSQYLRKRNLRIPFSFAVDLFSRILAIKKQVLNEGLALTTLDQWADKCPRCFGPQINENKAGPAEPDFIIALDGNFQQRHYAHASKDNPSEQQYPPGFVLPSRTVIDYQAVEESESLALGINVSFRSLFCFCSLFQEVLWLTLENSHHVQMYIRQQTTVEMVQPGISVTIVASLQVHVAMMPPCYLSTYTNPVKSWLSCLCFSQSNLQKAMAKPQLGILQTVLPDCNNPTYTSGFPRAQSWSAL